jgi:hypothetical protein
MNCSSRCAMLRRIICVISRKQPKQKETILNTKTCVILSNRNYFRLSDYGRFVISHTIFTQLIVCVIRDALGCMRDNCKRILVSHTLLPPKKPFASMAYFWPNKCNPTLRAIYIFKTSSVTTPPKSRLHLFGRLQPRSKS